MISADNEWHDLKLLTMKKALKGDVYMVYTESANIVEPQMLKELIEEEYSNPTIERMMFIETKKNERFPGKVFPCYVEGWRYAAEPTPPLKEELEFQICIMQCTGGEFGLVRAIIHESELGVSKRIWDKPPTKGLRDDFPFVEEGDQ